LKAGEKRKDFTTEIAEGRRGHGEHREKRTFPSSQWIGEKSKPAPGEKRRKID
jgi:hypothetical protein